ncbi:fibrinogen-like protein 1 isoform X2 [Hypomesus transpacificus]|uniref:fibrinogen-like protein 1 isoform X2 n=1 Tax=Hypomesus transpacificus TaxID=137520 RepID=UPI001F08852B|nr:fibrinogen-like protein 1 isoform X2 [Hypomesus transpacificus]
MSSMSGGRCQGNMMVRLGLLMIFPALCHCLESFCDATQGVTYCYTPLGGTMSRQLVFDANELELEFKKSQYKVGENILKKKNYHTKVYFDGPWKNRSHFYVNNGTLRITDMEQTDYGDYILTMHNINGTFLKNQKIQLLVGGGLSWLVVISSLAAVVLMAVLGYYFLRRRRQQPTPDPVRFCPSVWWEPRSVLFSCLDQVRPNKMETSKLLLIGVLVLQCCCVCASPECEQETARLRLQLRTLEARVLQQQQLIQRLQKQNKAESEDLGQLHLLPGHLYRDCAHIYNNGSKKSGMYMIQPVGSPAQVTVFCDMAEGGGWTVIQRRTDGSQSFNKPWADFKQGFGDFQSGKGEFWLGNDNLHYLTSQGEYSLRVNMEDFERSRRFAEYSSIKVADEEHHYQLQFGAYSGTAGDSLSGSYHPEVQWWASHQGMKFSTYDRDNDRYDGNCAQEDKSGWWFNRCHSANLNGMYHRGAYSAMTDDGMVWYTWHGWWYSLKSVVMKIRPAGFESNTVP